MTAVHSATSIAREDHEDGFLYVGLHRRVSRHLGEDESYLPRVPGFMRRSECSKPEYRYYDFIDHPGVNERRVCGVCPVRSECLAWAIETGQRIGLWGGMTDLERRRFKAKEATA